MELPRTFAARRWIQWASAVIVALIGVRFTLWVSAHLGGRWPDVSRPPAVEAFLPIDAMLRLRHLLETGIVDPVHPAGLAIFIGICLMSLVVAKSFCSHLCPIGLVSELLGRLGVRMTGRTLRIPSWIDAPLRGLKFLLLGFFVWAIWFEMSPPAVEAFLSSPYARVADVKMWMFFAEPSRLTVSVLGVLVVGSVLVRDLWCRYLCPYGALLGVLGRLAPFKIRRRASLCTDCRSCTRACPARLPVHAVQRVASIECTGCQDCVAACPVSGCLGMRPPAVYRHLGTRPVAAMVAAILAFVLVIAGFRSAGLWHTSVTEAEYRIHVQNIRSPVYTHVGGTAMTPPAPSGNAAVPGVPGHDDGPRTRAKLMR
jgi:ferredoxin